LIAEGIEHPVGWLTSDGQANSPGAFRLIFQTRHKLFK
jgi:hypothetical protein